VQAVQILNIHEAAECPCSKEALHFGFSLPIVPLVNPLLGFPSTLPERSYSSSHYFLLLCSFGCQKLAKLCELAASRVNFTHFTPCQDLLPYQVFHDPRQVWIEATKLLHVQGAEMRV